MDWFIIYVSGWLTGGFTCVMIYRVHLETKAFKENMEKLRQAKIRNLNPTKYGDIE